MSDRSPTYPNTTNGHANYNTTPVLSPTASITFSDSVHMGQMLDLPNMQYGGYHGQEILEPHQRWHQPEYSIDRVNSAPQLQHSHQHTVYDHPGPSSAVSVPVTTAVPYSQRAYIPESSPQWLSINTTGHPQMLTPAESQMSPAILQPVHSWQHQLPQHFERMESRHNSVASTSIATSMSTAPTTVDDIGDCLPSNSLHDRATLPIHDHRQHQQYSHSRVPSSVIGAAESLANGVRTGVHSPSSTSTTSSSSHNLLMSPQEPARTLSLQTAPASAPLGDPTQPVKRKRGRPRLIRDPEDAKRPRPDRPSRRQPHNEIERKYREGLNTEMEKLRDAIPRLPQGPIGQNQKATKAMVLKTAVEEIERLNSDYEKVSGENEKIKQDLERTQKELDDKTRELERLKQRTAVQ